MAHGVSNFGSEAGMGGGLLGIQIRINADVQSRKLAITCLSPHSLHDSIGQES